MYIDEGNTGGGGNLAVNKKEHRGWSAEDSPGKRAFIAILHQALLDLDTLRVVEDRGGKFDHVIDRQATYIQAYLWMASEREDYDMAFENVCAGLGINPEYIRRKAKISTDDNFFGWKELNFRD